MIGREAAMPKVEPSGPRSTITETPDGLRIVIPARRNWFLVLFIAVWLTMWVSIGGTFAYTSLVRAGLGGLGLFVLAWSAIWLVTSATMLYNLLWLAAGREVITVSERSLSTRRRIGPFRAGRCYEYTAEHIRDLRPDAGLSGGPWGSFGWNMRWGGIGVGGMAFDYGSRTHRFGDGIDEAEAKQIIAVIVQRLPSSG